MSISPHSKYPLSITNTTVSLSVFLGTDGDGVIVGVTVGVTEIGVTVTSKSKLSHLKSVGVIDGVEVIDGVGNADTKLEEGVGVTLFDGVVEGVKELEGVGVGVTVQEGSEHVVSPELTK